MRRGEARTGLGSSLIVHHHLAQSLHNAQYPHLPHQARVRSTKRARGIKPLISGCRTGVYPPSCRWGQCAQASGRQTLMSISWATPTYGPGVQVCDWAASAGRDRSGEGGAAYAGSQARGIHGRHRSVSLSPRMSSSLSRAHAQPRGCVLCAGSITITCTQSQRKRYGPSHAHRGRGRGRHRLTFERT